MYSVTNFFKNFGFLRFFSVFTSVTALTVLILQLCNIVEVEVTTLVLIGILAVPIISEVTIEVKGAKFSIKAKTDKEMLEEYEKSSPMFKEENSTIKSRKIPSQYKKDLNRMRRDSIEIQLAKIRMNITEKLNKLAEINGMGNLGFSIGFLTEKLDDMETLDENDALYLKELLILINKNLKGNKSDESINYIKRIYPTIMDILDKKIQEGDKNETSNS